MALLKTLWQLLLNLFKKKEKPTKTPITRDAILTYVEQTPHLRNSLKKSKAKAEQEERAEANANKKKIAKKKAQKKARKKNRKK
jgi:hypothetical protein